MDDFNLKDFDCGECYNEIFYNSDNDLSLTCEMNDLKVDSIDEYDDNEYIYELPYELTYNVNFHRPKFEVDFNKLQYQNLYKTYEFYEKRFGLGEGLEYIPAIKDVIQNIADSASLPLEDLEYIKMNSNNIHDEQK